MLSYQYIFIYMYGRDELGSRKRLITTEYATYEEMKSQLASNKSEMVLVNTQPVTLAKEIDKLSKSIEFVDIYMKTING